MTRDEEIQIMERSAKKHLKMWNKLKVKPPQKIKKWISRGAIPELGNPRLELNLYNKRALTKSQRELAYKEITIIY